MATDVILPALGMAQDTGKIVEWLKAEGEHVTAGEPLVMIETDKAAVDLEAPATGVLARVVARAGDEVPVAAVIAVILAPDETAGGDVVAAPAVAPVLGAPSAVAPVADAAPARPGTTRTGDLAPSGAPDGRRAASPKARRMAAERGVELAALRGTGPGGAVLAADVLAAASAGSAGASVPPVVAPPAAAPERPPAASPAAGEPAVSAIWRLMAERTTQSWTSVPHFFLVREVAAEGLAAWRARAGLSASPATERVTYSDLLVKICAEALRRHPRLNASWREGAIARNDEINVGLAVAIADGLVVPVIHQADDLSLAGIARRRADLVARAHAGRLRPHDLQDGTFTISNLGTHGVDAFTAIINAPQAAILAVGRVAERVVAVDGRPVVRPMLTLSLSCDHRVVDGARGAEFLATVAALIEDPSPLAG